MKPAVIFSLPAMTSRGYCWRWRSVDGKTDSAGPFAFYQDCREDAQANGYAVQLRIGGPAAGGSEYHLEMDGIRIDTVVP